MSERNKVYFASDMHFGSLYHENPRAVEQKFANWLSSIKDDAHTIVLVGDIFDYWYEYKYVVPRGYTRILGKLAELSDAGVEVILFTGNHDIWMFDYLPHEIGCTIYRQPTQLELLGTTFFIAHGDEFIEDDKGYRFLQTLFRNKLCQKLYASLHPRWTVGLAHRWALASRKRGVKKGFADYKGENNEYLVRWAKKQIKSLPEEQIPSFFIFGHRHIPLDLQLTHHTRILILGDWLRHFSYAVWDGTQMILTSYEEGEQ